MTGQAAYLAGKASEEHVMQHYLASGHILVARRWRGAAGEIDLVLEKNDEVILVEVKTSRNHSRAAESLTLRQQRRLLRSAEDCLGGFPKGSMTPMRFDVALVDAVGQLDIITNALTA